MIDVATLNKRLGDILMLSLRPAQLMLATSAAVMALIFFAEGGDAIQPYADHLYVNAYVAAAMFLVYACASLYCSMSVKKHKHTVKFRYITAFTGLFLWTIMLALEMLIDKAPSTVLHAMPICAEGWVIAQLMSNIHEQDRRAL